MCPFRVFVIFLSILIALLAMLAAMAKEPNEAEREEERKRKEGVRKKTDAHILDPSTPLDPVLFCRSLQV